MPTTSRNDTGKRTVCIRCGHSVRRRTNGSAIRHQYIRNGKKVVCPEGDRGPKPTQIILDGEMLARCEDRQESHRQRVARLLTWIGHQPGYRATARGDHFLVVGPRPDREPVRIPRTVCEDQQWKQVLADLYRLGLTCVLSADPGPATATAQRRAAPLSPRP